MSLRIYRSIKESIRISPSWDERWNGYDRGLINSWERGRKMREEAPELAKKAENGELPRLGWKGGVDVKINDKKYGSIYYLAQWQGLRGNDLDIDASAEYTLTCSRTGSKVTFTVKVSKVT